MTDDNKQQVKAESEPKKRIIMWEKWDDPFIKPEKTEEDAWKDSYDKSEEERGGSCLMTPMGVVHLNTHSSLTKRFNFWQAQTNFNITSGIRDIVKKTEGVETLDIFTRYRMRIGIGQMFNDQEVRREIDKRLLEHLNKQRG